MSPKGKAPWITIASESDPSHRTVIADSHFIVKHLVASGLGEDLDAELTPVQRAETRAFVWWTEGVFFPAINALRWSPLWPKNYEEWYKAIPIPGFLQWWPVKPILMFFIRRRNVQALEARDVGKHTKEEVESLLKEWVDGVSVRLGDGEGWFHGGTEPTYVDVVLGSNLMQIALRDVAELVELVGNHANLLRYTERCVDLWFPEYEEFKQKLARMKIAAQMD